MLKKGDIVIVINKNHKTMESIGIILRIAYYQTAYRIWLDGHPNLSSSWQIVHNLTNAIEESQLFISYFLKS